jgi:pectate lyase
LLIGRRLGHGRKTNGGADADAAHSYTVRSRKELILALHPDAVFAADGSYTTSAGPDATPKIILIQRTIDLDTDASGKPHTPADFYSRYRGGG